MASQHTGVYEGRIVDSVAGVRICKINDHLHNLLNLFEISPCQKCVSSKYVYDEQILDNVVKKADMFFLLTLCERSLVFY